MIDKIIQTGHKVHIRGKKLFNLHVLLINRKVAELTHHPSSNLDNEEFY